MSNELKKLKFQKHQEIEDSEEKTSTSSESNIQEKKKYINLYYKIYFSLIFF